MIFYEYSRHLLSLRLGDSRCVETVRNAARPVSARQQLIYCVIHHITIAKFLNTSGGACS